MRKLIAMLLTLAMFVMLMVPVAAADKDIVDTADGAGSFTVLLAALDKAELTQTLKGEGPFTVFAPTDEAFAALLDELGIAAEALLNHPDLSKVLLYHVVAGKVMSTDLTDGMEAATLQGEKLRIGLMDGVKINDAMVTAADVDTTNGVIHIIDKVLVPAAFQLSAEPESVPAPVAEEMAAATAAPTMNIVETAIGNPEFSILVAALQKAGLVDALNGEGPFTVFAPTNDAFAALLQDLDISADELLTQPDLSKVLLYHVVSGKVMSTDLTNGLTAPTLQGESLSFDLTDGVKVNGSTVVAADVDTTNGVIHVIDKVLVPAGFTLVDTAEETVIPKTDDQTILFSGLLVLAGLAGMTAAFVAARRRKGVRVSADR